jgi:hypothetical protein
MAANNRVSLEEASITETAHSVAAALARAAQPGPVPTATGASPIDGAAASVAAAVGAHVAASAAELAPRSAEGLAKSEAALAELKAQDATNASEIKAVPADLQATSETRGGSAGVQPVAGDPWEDWENFRDGSEPEPLGPPGAGPGQSVIPGSGVPAQLVSNSSGGDDWFYGEDGIDRLPGPAGAGPGPSVIPGTGVPEELI